MRFLIADDIDGMLIMPIDKYCIIPYIFSMGNKEMDVAFITRRLMGEWCADALIIHITSISNVQRSQILVYIIFISL